MAIETGGPAFPVFVPADGGCGPHVNEGMSLRDWFAGQALIGLFAREANPMFGTHTEEFKTGQHEYPMAEAAYRLADAMIATRNQEPPS